MPPEPRTRPDERGSTTVANRAVRRIAERAATEVRTAGPVLVSGASASVRGRRARVALNVTLPYPGPLDEAGERVRSHVVDRTARLTGLAVPSARIHVHALSRQDGTEAAGSARAVAAETGPDPARTARRPWSERRLPMGLFTLTAAAACGVLLYEVVSVHAAGRAPARWRVDLLDWLSAHGPGVTAVDLAAAAGVFALGVWLLILAVTPGKRRRIPLATPAPGVHATLERAAAAALLRDAVRDVPGITRVRVRMGRRGARVRTRLGFGDQDAAREAVRQAALAATDGFGLARPLKLRVRVRTEPTWRAPTAHETSGSTR
ncbi:DUF6286 domain-containing Asp23/Gls24 family envelope stress response protein [Streptomyces kanamyceticus]|uniref:Asp23/Gls24 family envelope stress response protein n=2 Tax=Streptomyces kanamyceticus TaxID=1967 RepID=A0A5J6GAE0_STRKN|nr:DUF6286 domain-containing protein [Streptomyces kanamyceticus]QEU90915.1 Asp23/Gls24 family envelope stress response protein [Streptomyces kanamyceticus]